MRLKLRGLRVLLAEVAEDHLSPPGAIYGDGRVFNLPIGIALGDNSEVALG